MQRSIAGAYAVPNLFGSSPFSFSQVQEHIANHTGIPKDCIRIFTYSGHDKKPHSKFEKSCIILAWISGAFRVKKFNKDISWLAFQNNTTVQQVKGMIKSAELPENSIRLSFNGVLLVDD
jgi:hypothetical protein